MESTNLFTTAGDRLGEKGLVVIVLIENSGEETWEESIASYTAAEARLGKLSWGDE